MEMKELKVLKAQKTKLLSKSFDTLEEFEEIQEQLNTIENKIKELESDGE